MKKRLADIRNGALFVTTDGIVAVKSEYHYANGQSECILLASGEYAHFPNKNNEQVFELPISTAERNERERILGIIDGLKATHQERHNVTASQGERFAQRYVLAVLDTLVGHIESGSSLDELVASMYG